MRRGAAALLVIVAACADPAPPPSGPLLETVPAEPPVRFAVIGDFGSGDEAELGVATAVHAWVADRGAVALVTTGDNVYDDGNPEDFDEAWHEPYAWVAREGIDVVAALGNHDVGTDGGEPVMELLGMPGRWYARRYGPVEFVVLDGNDLDDASQRAFLARVLRASAAAWQVVIVHQAPYTCGRHEDDAEEVREAVGTAFEEGGADLVLSGHDHNYQRFPPVGGVTFVVTGGGGAELYELEGCEPGTPAPVVGIDDAHHFLTASATRHRLRVSAVLVPSGEVADRVTLAR